jgi:hypothetical protein
VIYHETHHSEDFNGFQIWKWTMSISESVLAVLAVLSIAQLEKNQTQL